MSLTNEDLLAISQLLDSKLKPITADVKNIHLTLENDVLPGYERLNLATRLHLNAIRQVLTKSKQCRLILMS